MQYSPLAYSRRVIIRQIASFTSLRRFDYVQSANSVALPKIPDDH